MREVLRFARWMLVAATGCVAWGQGMQSAGSAPSGAVAQAPRTARRPGGLRFSDESPVLGFPLGSSKSTAHCSIDGTAFYDLTANSATAGQDIFGIAPDGGVKHLLRKLPIDFTNVSVRDFFVGDQQLVTLLQADKRDAGTEASPPRERDYFLSLEDEAGDLSDLVALNLRFKPVKTARFGSGDVVVLGWDEGNLLPVLAYVGADGTVHRFIDLDERRANVTSDASARKEAAEHTKETLDTLQGAAFVAFGSDVLLTYPGTTKPARVLTAIGGTRMIPITIPEGYVLNDVLVSGPRGTMVVRVKDADDSRRPAAAPGADAPKMRLLEEDSTHGSLIRELIPEKPKVEDVTCAANYTVSAVFYDTIPDANSNGAGGSSATQLVVATARR